MKTLTIKELESYGIKPIPNFPGYFASRKGSIFSSKSGRIRKLKIGDTYRGYQCIGLIRSDGRKITKKVHHLVLEAFVGPKPSPLHLARHLNDDGYDNRIENLAWGTNEDNIEDQKKNGRTSSNKRNLRNYFDIERKNILLRIFESGICDKNELAVLLRCSEKAILHQLKSR